MTLFEAITWKQYLAVIGIALILYYAVILLRNRKGNFSNLLNRNKKIRWDTQEHFFADDDDEQVEESQQREPEHNIHSFDELEALVTEIRHSILEKAGKGASKEELLQQLSNRLANYGGLRQPAYRIALINFIIEQSENICGVTFSEEELEEAWGKLPR